MVEYITYCYFSTCGPETIPPHRRDPFAIKSLDTLDIDHFKCWQASPQYWVWPFVIKMFDTPDLDHFAWWKAMQWSLFAVNQGSHILVKYITVNIRPLPTMFKESAENVSPQLADVRHIQQTRCSLHVEVSKENKGTVFWMLPSLQIVFSARLIVIKFTLHCAPQVKLHTIPCSCSPSINADIH